MIKIPGPIPIHIHPLFFAIAGLIGLLQTQVIWQVLTWMGVIFISVLVHEFGHALTAMGFGHQTKITLMLSGGITERKGGPLKLWQEFLVVINGPLFGFVLCILSFLALGSLQPEKGTFLYIALGASTFINFFWNVLNLFPVGPLDGGRLLNICLEAVLGTRGIRIGYFIGIIVGAIVGILGFVVGQPFIGALFCLLAFESFRAFQQALQMTEHDGNEAFQARFASAQTAYVEGRKDEALTLFQKLRHETNEGLIYTASSEYAGRLLSDRGEFEIAYDILLPLEHALSAETKCLLHRLAYYNREMDVVIRLGKNCFEAMSNPETAYINALAHGDRGDVQAAVGWLRTARREGLEDMKSRISAREFDAVRDTEAFQLFVEELGA